jgi:hypothetical protein
MLTVLEQAALGMFVSPSSGKALVLHDGRLVTGDGSESYRIADGRVFFLHGDESGSAAVGSMEAQYEAYHGRFERLRRLLRSTILTSVRSRDSVRAFEEFGRATAGTFVLGVGGGPMRDFSAVNLNIGPWANVEIVADAHALPYASDSVDNVSCLAVLEHLPRPGVAMAEMVRVLKPGGYILLETPGLQPYHGFPNHFQNFTLTGHDLLIEQAGVEKIGSGPSIGPTSAMVALAAEYLRQYVPGGSVLGPAFKGSLGLALAQLDRMLGNRPNAFILSGGSYFLGRKPRR